MSSEPQPLALSLDHVAVAVPEFASLGDFLCKVAGMVEGARPAFRTPGRWLYAEGSPVVHLIPAPAGVVAAPRVSHFALRVACQAEWFELIRRLDANGIGHVREDSAEPNERQLFVLLSPGLQTEFVTSFAPSA